ncbi:DinB family protein [Kutzneria viridogrisea]|uniref:Mini-circle protein n=2 Tax=Kutzneria TaxID=43356 RepID=W5W9E4_9PSEU|nr:DinB family protein [Kutzneria albida]AHH97136.1 hypothetical protein KALB_3772 [Kutzneria albida DSM 43870]MBA8931893.1 putative damage-inducible protein DinB [Kutzneria viridogrisea]
MSDDDDAYSAVWAGDTRRTPPLVGDEREVLTSYLDWHRETFELKCADIARRRLSERSVPPSTMSLHGLVRHLAAVERYWFAQQFAGQQLPDLYYTRDDPDQDFNDLAGDVDEVFAVWREECRRSREIVAAAELGQTGVHRRSGDPVSLRRILVHMIAEYARHNGHADLLREALDGRVGM